MEESRVDGDQDPIGKNQHVHLVGGTNGRSLWPIAGWFSIHKVHIFLIALSENLLINYSWVLFGSRSSMNEITKALAFSTVSSGVEISVWIIQVGFCDVPG